VDSAIEQLPQATRCLRHGDFALLRQPPCEGDLVIVYRFSSDMLPGHHDGFEPSPARVHHRTWAGVRHDRHSTFEGLCHIFVPQVLHGLGMIRRRRGPGLHKTWWRLATYGQPFIDPANKTIEGVMIGADRDEDERAGLDRRHVTTASQ
jgi:hypothetical protein